ncbi:MAG: thioredoxin family protein [Gammaproteobacteria bacterium]|nr:thioredoxin family protein [Gammaproteobacteria bacterium]
MRRSNGLRCAVLCVMLALIAGCPRGTAPIAGTPPVAGTARSADAATIDWIEGDLTAGLAQAARHRRPLLVYWGAGWCPPCQQLQATIFQRRDFIERSRQFVAVHLDGDDPGAQKWGERLRVQGYPTLLVLDMRGHEVQRIAGGMDLERFAVVLELALADLQPVEVLLAQLRSGAALPRDACRRLAWNGWRVEVLESGQLAGRAAELERAARYCTAQAAPDAARLVIYAAGLQAATEARAIAAGASPSATLLGRIDAVSDVLRRQRNDPVLSDALIGLDDDFFGAAARAAPRYVALRDAYVEAMQAAAQDARLAVADQLAAMARGVAAAKWLSPGSVIPAAQAAAARARVVAELARRWSADERSGIVNGALNVYEALGDAPAAYEVARAELATAREKYYVKADLGSLAEELGRREEALRWYAEAYAESLGTATRFQWGQMYASALLRLAPQDAGRIRAVTLTVLGELDGPDRIYRRARLRLETLEHDLEAWNAAAGGRHADVLAALRARLQQACARVPEGESAHASGMAFLSGAG